MEDIFFKRVRLSCARQEGSKPLEVMGMMLGRPHTEQLDTLVVTDVRPRARPWARADEV